MYKKQTSMSLKGTPSMLPNNMATNKTKNLSYAVVHKSVVCVSTVVAAGSSPVQKQIACKGEGTTGNSTVMQVQLLPYNVLICGCCTNFWLYWFQIQ